MTLLKINNNDYSSYVQTSSYDMNNSDVYDEWIDGNHKTHREIYRKKVVGQIDVVFTSTSSHQTFIQQLKAKTDTEGKTKLSVYLPIEAVTKEIEAYVDISSALYTDIKNGYVVDRLSLSIQEA